MGFHGLQQRGSEGNVQHGGFIHHDHIGRQRVVLVPFEAHHPFFRGKGGFQHPVQGLGFPVAHLTEFFGRPAGGGTEKNRQTVLIQQGQKPLHRCGFPGTRPAGDQGQGPVEAQTHGLLLLFRIGHPLLFLSAGNHLFQVPRRFQMHAQQPYRLPGHGVLLTEQCGQIDHGLAPDILFHHLLPLQQLLQLIFHILFPCVAQRCGGRQQFLPRNKAMAALQIEGKLIQNSSPQPHRTQRVHTHVPGGLVHLAKIQTEPLLAQKIGVLPQSLLCISSIDLVNPGGAPHGQAAFGEKLQKSPHGVLLEKILLDLPGFP